MPRNVEIKATIHGRDLEGFVETVRSLSQSEGTLLQQEDTFFCSPNGRLKLRKYEASCLSFVNPARRHNPLMIGQLTDAAIRQYHPGHTYKQMPPYVYQCACRSTCHSLNVSVSSR